MIATTILTLGGVVSHTNWASLGRPVENAPVQFEPAPAYGPVPDAPPGGATCLVHLVDPRDNTHLTLVESDAGADRGSLRGHYNVVPAGRYDLRSGHRLRVHCPTRRAIGAVRS